MSKNFEKERNGLLNQIKKLPAPEAIEKLKSLRKDYDWAIPGYRNSLNILSDTTYKDRKHFLLELIQNADDAIYTGKKPELKFIIEESGITLQYNEDGFSVDDIIAITDTGESTKIQGNRLSHKFIGEKGIGFKSVFALASSVEIESLSWHFLLKKNECIVPHPIKNYNIKKGDGTTLKISFEEPESIELVAKELKRIIEGDMESFLFLNQLSKLTIEDRRQKSFKISSIEIKPIERNSEHLEIFSSELEETRKFYLFAKDLDFPGDLVKKRWEKLNFKGKSLKRKIIVAFPDLTTKENIPVGRLYCYLPTNVSLPVPLYLQVDGVTTANREQLHDPNQNPWNRYLISMIPGIIVEAILSLKKNPDFTNHLVDYIPWDNGDQQLNPQFEEVIDLLKKEKWVKTFHSGKDEWVCPEDAIIPTKFLESLIIAEPAFRTRAEKYLNKKFVNSEWLKNSEWKSKLQEYGIKKIDDETFIKIIEAATIPQQWLKKSENLVALYSKILKIPCLQNQNNWRFKEQYLEVRSSLLNSSIFPLPNRGFNSLNLLDKKVFWISSRSSRETGLEDSVDYIIISTEYTYQPKESGNANEVSNIEFELKKKRNKQTRELLECLKIPELNDENILTELQIPYLVDNPYTKNEENIRFKVLYSIFQKYKSKHKKNKINSEDFIGELSNLSEAEFKSISGEIKPIKDLSLPCEFKLKPEDHVFDNYFEEMYCPKKSLKSEKDDTKNKRNKERLIKLKEEWHDFLILIGIRNKPKFIVQKDRYSNVHDFRDKNPVLYNRWIEKIGKDYTYNNPVYLHSIILDEATRKIILDNSNNKDKLSNSLYTEWKNNLGSFDLSSEIYSYPGLKLKVGICYVEYTRHNQRVQKLEDDKWCGLDSGLIPLIDIKGEFIPAKESIRIKPSDVKQFQISKKYFHLVIESPDIQKENTYHSDYLDSLKINNPNVEQINNLWKDVESENYDEIIKIALEFASNDYDLTNLLIFDKNKRKLRPATEFCIGTEAPSEIPLIERQYGDIGKRIGDVLGLKDGVGSSSYLGLFDQIFSSRRISKKNLKLLHDLLVNYQSWKIHDKRIIEGEFIEAVKKANRDKVTIIVNNEDIYKLFYNSEIWVAHIETSEDNLFDIQESAQQIGFKLSDEIGEIKFKNEVQISSDEKEDLNRIFIEYRNKLSKKNKSRLQGRLRSIDLHDFSSTKIFRVDEIFRIFKECSNKIPVELPYHDKQKNVFYMEPCSEIADIIAYILDFAVHGCYEDLISKIRYISEQYYENKLSDLEIDSNTQDISNENNTQFVRETLEKNSKREKIKDSKNWDSSGWKCAPDPEEEDESKVKIARRISDNLEQGPEYINKKIRSKLKKQKKIPSNIKIVDPNYISPDSFFFEEYKQRCQICGTQLELCTGKFFNMTFHIAENPDKEIWWNDQPYNILCMCPNCHALAKNGGYEFNSIFSVAEEFDKGNLFPIELSDYNGDYYLVEIEINGVKRNIAISPIHMMYFAALTKDEK